MNTNGIKGSPPHTRGKVSGVLKLILIPRITPAHAGKSLSVRRYSARLQDHPRTRGEKAENLKLELAAIWITPAHAGKRGYISPVENC